MRELKKTIISLTTLSLTIANITSLTFANPETEKIQIKNAINQTEPFIITGNIPKENEKSNVSPEQLVIQYLNQLQTTSTFKLKSKEDDKQDGQVIVRLQQYINNIPIYGSDTVACVDYNGTIKSISGYIEPTVTTLEDFKYKFNMTKEQAINIATKEFEIDKNIEAELYVYKNKDKYTLAYKVHIEMIDTELYNKTIFIDANDGTIINQYENINNIVQTKTFKAKGVFGDDKEIQVVYKQGEENFKDGYYFIDTTRGNNPIQTLDIKGQYYYQYYYQDNIPNSMEDDIKYYSQNLEESDGKFVDAHYYVGKAYDFYYNKFNRDGLDTKGSKPVVLVNVNNPGNVFYTQVNGIDILAFGNGNLYNHDASGSIDTVGHEYTHSIVQHTANLEYVSQSGAIDEAYADIFGTLIEHSYKSDFNWSMGEDFTKHGYLRSLSNPEIDHIDKLKICNEPHEHNLICDNNYVHDNSGVIAKVAYLISQGGTHNNVQVEGLGETRMGEIFYNALTEGLYSQSDFKHLGEVLVSKAKTTKEKETIENALKSVGIIEVAPEETNVIINKTVENKRDETSTNISQNGWSQANNTVLVNSDDMADALPTTPVTKSKDAPILLTGSDSLNDETKKETIRLNDKNVHAIGGTSVVSENVPNQPSLEITNRLGSTSEISLENGVSGVPDAVSIAPIAATKNMPRVLVSPSQRTKVFGVIIIILLILLLHLML